MAALIPGASPPLTTMAVFISQSFHLQRACPSFATIAPSLQENPHYAIDANHSNDSVDCSASGSFDSQNASLGPTLAK